MEIIKTIRSVEVLKSVLAKATLPCLCCSTRPTVSMKLEVAKHSLPPRRHHPPRSLCMRVVNECGRSWRGETLSDPTNTTHLERSEDIHCDKDGVGEGATREERERE